MSGLRYLLTLITVHLMYSDTLIKWILLIKSLFCDFLIRPFDETALTDYFVYVRKPIDLSTVKYKLDGTVPTLGNKPDHVSLYVIF